MGPSVKFVSAIIDAFSNKKWGSIFFTEKTKPEGGGSPSDPVRGGFANDHTFSGFFFGYLPLYAILEIVRPK